jgi:hypothetical protein
MGDVAIAVPTTAALLIKVLLEIFFIDDPFFCLPPPYPSRKRLCHNVISRRQPRNLGFASGGILRFLPSVEMTQNLLLPNCDKVSNGRGVREK